MAYLQGRTMHGPAVLGTGAAYRSRSSIERAIGDFEALEQTGTNVAVSNGEFGRALRGLGIPTPLSSCSSCHPPS